MTTTSTPVPTAPVLLLALSVMEPVTVVDLEIVKMKTAEENSAVNVN